MVMGFRVFIFSSFSATMGDTMRKTMIASLAIVFAMTCFTAVAFAKKVPGKSLGDYNFHESAAPADLPADLQGFAGPQLSSAAADTFHLAWFNFGAGVPDAQGWTTIDLTENLDDYFHVAGGAELNGGTFGKLLPLEGLQSLWCGVAPSAAIPYCGYATLPGYGNSWSQEFTSKNFAGCDSVEIWYKICWDSEPGYDATVIQSSDGGAFTTITAANGGVGFYDGTGIAVECVGARSTTGNIQLRFLFTADGAWSDEDGLWPTDGAVTLDSITVVWYNEVPPASGNWLVSAVYGPEDFEDEAVGSKTTDDGCWSANKTPGFGDFGAIYAGVNVTQEDPCFTDFGFLWGFFDDPLITAYLCHVPNPLPTQGAMRFGPDSGGLYMNSGIESPLIPNVGAGAQYNLTFLSYRDLPLDNLQFYQWSIRSHVGGCPTAYENDNFVFYGGQKDWLRTNFNIGAHISAGASDLQILLNGVDACGFWCGVFGTGACHSHAPLIDQCHLTRTNVVGPQYVVRHLDLFQDNFADDGTLTGHARADCANDIAPSTSATILPGDSVTLTLSGVGTDPTTGVGPSAYIYVAVWPQGQSGKTPADLEAPETRAGVGKRYPLVGTVDHDGVTWACFRMDSAITTAGAVVADRYAIDLNDWVFTPCDTICYVFCADDGLGNVSYFSRTLNGQGANFVTDDLWTALNSPMEFTILPAGGWKRGGDILYVDDTDDRGGPVQLFFDSSFDMLGIRELVDRYDVLGPSSVVANSLASRVKNFVVQICDCYRKIIWSSGNLSTGLIGDGTGNPEKSNDFALLFQFLDTKPNNPGLYISGDDVAEEWSGLAGASAIGLRSIYMNFNLIDGNHRNVGNAISPVLTAVGPCFIHLGIPDQLIAYGGCALINDFDVLQATGGSVPEFNWPVGGGSAVLSQTTPNNGGSDARVILSGFSYHYIRDIVPGFPPARVEHLRDILIWLINVIPEPTGIPTVTARNFLENAAPNPFNPTTNIRFGVKERGQVTLKIYNVAGQLVRTLVNEVKAPRPEGFEVTWDGRNNSGTAVSSGVYFYKLSTSNFTQTKKMVLLK